MRDQRIALLQASLDGDELAALGSELHESEREATVDHAPHRLVAARVEHRGLRHRERRVIADVERDGDEHARDERGVPIWDDRLEDIRNFESYLSKNGIMVLKIFLNVSKKEQKKRFLERIDKPEKNWKFSAADVEERKFWKPYQAAYEELIKKTATEKSPWYVVPADNKTYARMVVASAIIAALDSMKLAYPEVSDEQLAQLQRLRQELLAEK